MTTRDLTEPERALYAAFPRGEVVDLRVGLREADDASGGDGWGGRTHGPR